MDYKQVYHRSLERSSSGIAPNCRKIMKSDLSSGDLVFFNTSRKRKGINHVGLFLKTAILSMLLLPGSHHQ
ncbi:MAG: NlpC/P60 family protein [Odoribacter splanchnicus]